MPRPRFDKLSPERRREILETAAGEFVAHGFKGASLNRVIGSLGLSKGAFYYYFDDKADLFVAVLQFAWDLVLTQDALDFERLNRDDFWPKLAAVARQARERLLANPWTLEVSRLWYSPPADPKVRRLIAGKLAEGQALREAWIRRGQALGTVRTDLPNRLLLGLLTAVDDAVDRWLLEHWQGLDAGERDRIGDVAFRLLRTLLEPPTGDDREGDGR